MKLRAQRIYFKIFENVTICRVSRNGVAIPVRINDVCKPGVLAVRSESSVWLRLFALNLAILCLFELRSVRLPWGANMKTRTGKCVLIGFWNIFIFSAWSIKDVFKWYCNSDKDFWVVLKHLLSISQPYFSFHEVCHFILSKVASTEIYRPQKCEYLKKRPCLPPLRTPYPLQIGAKTNFNFPISR